MSRIGVTGATGHLGRVLVNRVVHEGHEVVPVGRTWDDHLDVDVLLHLAAPDHRDAIGTHALALLNERVQRWSTVTGTRVIGAGTWWQYAGPEAERLPYTRMKADQQDMLGTTVILFSVYGHAVREGRGFVPQLVEHCQGRTRLRAASRQPRDWTHAGDVCAAFMAAIAAPEGVYEASTRRPVSPDDLVQMFAGERLPDYPERPSCEPAYRHPTVPGWRPDWSVTSYLRHCLSSAA